MTMPRRPETHVGRRMGMSFRGTVCLLEMKMLPFGDRENLSRPPISDRLAGRLRDLRHVHVAHSVRVLTQENWFQSGILWPRPDQMPIKI